MMKPNVVGIAGRKPKRIRDHMLWAQPGRPTGRFAKIAFPFIDCRRIRLVPSTDGLVGAVVIAENGTRVDTGTENIDDPQSTTRSRPVRPIRVALARRAKIARSSVAEKLRGGVAGEPSRERDNYVSRFPLDDAQPARRWRRLLGMAHLGGFDAPSKHVDPYGAHHLHRLRRDVGTDNKRRPIQDY